jgi:hypothetical protein
VQLIRGLSVNSRVATYLTMLEVKSSVYRVLVVPWKDLRMDRTFINI